MGVFVSAIAGYFLQRMPQEMGWRYMLALGMLTLTRSTHASYMRTYAHTRTHISQENELAQTHIHADHENSLDKK